MKVIHDNINTFLFTPGKYFVIPDFQRPYSWDKANVFSFLEDVESVMIESKNHYFGSIVFINEGDNRTIIDGQQRVTTVLLMLTALCHIIKDNPQLSTISAEEIEDKYLYNKHDYTKEKNRIKLRTVTTDNKIFEEIFDRQNYSENSKDSKLYQAYAYFLEYFQGKNNLEKYIDALEHFEIVTIVLELSDDNPQKVFESINSTGKPLTDGDKIRNFALMLNNEEARKIVLNQYWGKIEIQLTDINKDYISDFFKYYLTSQLQKEVKIEQVYPEFKKLFIVNVGENQEDIQKLEKFYGTVIDYLNYYTFLKFNRKHNDFFADIFDKAFRINFLKIETPFPFLMRVLDEYTKGNINTKELSEIFSVIENYLARRIICNMPTTGLNKFFSTLHKDIKNFISKNSDANYVEVFKSILINRLGDLRVPKDSEIESAIQNNPFYMQKNIYINFILSSIDDQSHESKLLKQMANGDIQLTIEHIMPQTLNKKWKEDLGEDYDLIQQQYVHTLPNLTLTAYNSKYSNNDFTIKKTIENGFNESPLIINQFIKKFNKWDLSALKKRDKWWLLQIEKIWPIPKSTFIPESQESELTFSEDADLTGSRIKGINLFGEIVPCNSWIVAFEIILKKFFDLDSNLFDYIITDDYLHRYIKSSPKGFRNANPLDGTPYFYEGNTNTNLKRNIIVKLIDHLEFDKTDIRAILNNPE
jgi:uncharacterized protein with ParB-like and HNH nuclease domain